MHAYTFIFTIIYIQMSNVSFCSPHLCVAFLFVILYPAASSASSSTASASSTIFHIQLCHPPSFTQTIFHTHNFVTHTIFHTPSFTTPSFTHTQLCHTTSLPHIILVTHHLCDPPSFTHHLWRHVPSFHMAGVTLPDIHLRFASQAWHLWHWAGSGGLGRAWSPVTGRRGTWSRPPSYCVALGTWHLVTFTFHRSSPVISS